MVDDRKKAKIIIEFFSIMRNVMEQKSTRFNSYGSVLGKISSAKLRNTFQNEVGHWLSFISSKGGIGTHNIGTPFLCIINVMEIAFF